jgi:pimeloyl-ACP methyl ester carboxylesterase
MVAQVDRTELVYDDIGVGDPVLLVHGHPFDRSMWRPQVTALVTAGWRAIAPDLRGYGESSTSAEKTTLGEFATDLVAVLDHAEVDTAHVVGLSMGGQIVMELMEQIPHRILSLVLADTSARPETSDGVRARRENADRLLRDGMWDFAAEVLPRMIAPANIDALPHVADHVLSMMRRTSPQGAAAALRGRAERPDYTDSLRKVRVPTLVVVGRDDDFTPLADAKLIRDLVPGADLAVFDGAGHLPNLETPDQFNARLLGFLDPQPRWHGRRIRL